MILAGTAALAAASLLSALALAVDAVRGYRAGPGDPRSDPAIVATVFLLALGVVPGLLMLATRQP